MSNYINTKMEIWELHCGKLGAISIRKCIFIVQIKSWRSYWVVECCNLCINAFLCKIPEALLQERDKRARWVGIPVLLQKLYKSSHPNSDLSQIHGVVKVHPWYRSPCFLWIRVFGLCAMWRGGWWYCRCCTCFIFIILLLFSDGMPPLCLWR